MSRIIRVIQVANMQNHVFIVKSIIFAIIAISTSCYSEMIYGQTMAQKNVIVQMNYCVNSLTNIVNNHSMIALNYESDQILNNLKIDNIRGEYELQEFRIALFDAISGLQITEQERAILKQIQDIKSKKMMWNCLSSALNPTMLITGGGKAGQQIAFQAILTAARTAVDYQSSKGENEIEEIQAMWEIKKRELEEINTLRSKALKILFSLYDRYHYLDEWDRLTEETSNKFNEIISEPKSAKRVRLLKENEKLFKMIPDFYYYLGMAYIGDDINGRDANYKMSLPYLNKYLNEYAKAPIFRYDQKSGIIALTKLTFDETLSDAEIEALINTALRNLPDNGAALLQCALIYITKLGKKEKGFDLLRSGLDNRYSNKTEVLSTITQYLDDIKRYSNIYKEVIAAVNQSASIEMNAFVPFILANSKGNWVENVNKVFRIEDGPGFIVMSRRKCDYSGLALYAVKSSGSKMSIVQQSLIPENSFTHEELKKRVPEFAKKGNEKLVFCFFEPVIYGKRYSVKKGLDYNAISKGTFQGADVFSIADPSKIVSFCEKNENGDLVKVNCKPAKVKVKASDERFSFLDQYYLPRKSVDMVKPATSSRSSEYMYNVEYKGEAPLSFVPVRFEKTEGEFCVLDFEDLAHTIITYKKEGSGWIPFSIEQNGILKFKEPQLILDPQRDGSIKKAWNSVRSTVSDVADKVENRTYNAVDAISNKATQLSSWAKGKFSKGAASDEKNKK